MGTLGKYLREARELCGVDLRDAAQQTRINIRYRKALEEEDFSRLPGEIFVKGFLKNYAKFLRLDQSEVIKKYSELMPPRSSLITAAPFEVEQVAGNEKQAVAPKISLESIAWTAGIAISLVLFLFAALPARHPRETRPAATVSESGQTAPVSAPAQNKPDKLYLEVAAQENTWLLVRIDTSPQKKAVLKKGESLTWRADERFQLSYGSAGALKLLLNGRELTVNEPRHAVVRDLVVTASGIVSRRMQPEYARPKRQPAALPRQAETPEQKPITQPQQLQPLEQKPAPEPQRTQEAVPQAQVPDVLSPPAKPAALESQQTPTAAQ